MDQGITLPPSYNVKVPSDIKYFKNNSPALLLHFTYYSYNKACVEPP
jgi:hypothetical protein